MKRRFATMLAMICLPWLQGWSADQGSIPCDVNATTEVRLADNRIEYRGLIDEAAVAKVFELYEAAQPKPHTFVIESRGGSADAGMKLGVWLFDRELDVEVDTFCFSTCANYIFTAGRRKLLAARAALMWHGGTAQSITPQELEQVLDRTLAAMSTQERQQLLDRHQRSGLLQQLQSSLQELRTRCETL